MPLVIFDLDNTLVDRDTSFRRWAVDFVGRRGLGPDDLDWLVTADGDGFTPRTPFAAAIHERYGLDGSVASVLEQLRGAIVANMDLDPAATVMLDRLRHNGWRVAIATNGDSAQQRAKIRRFGLEAHVDGIAVSGEVGVHKPDRRMFEAAAERCGARLADGGWMVGDCATRDIGGGRAVGLRTIWLRRGRTWDPAELAPDAIVDRLAEAEPHLTH